ncbi:MAG: hypothetical protein Q7R69_01280 [bacterium]|nr:hypothetical protein [bacterium]
MKKILIILVAIIAITLAVFFGWYLFFQNSDMPVGEVVRNVLPFGSGGDTSLPVNLPGGNEQLPNGQQLPADEFARPNAKLFRIADTPIAGAVVFKRGNQTVVRYVDRATGHIYDADLATLEKVKVSNNTLPKIYEAYFRTDGNAVLLRSLKDNSDVVENLSLTLTPPQSSSTLYAISSTALRGNIGAVAVGSGNTLVYTLRDTATVVASAFNGTGARILLTSPFTDWRLASAGNSLVLYTKASVNAPGYAYALNTSGGALKKVIGPLNGLVALPDSSGNRVLYSYVENNKTKLVTKNLTNNIVSEISPVTLAEKCLWSIRNAGILFCAAPTDNLGPDEPDSWYRGVTHFSDRIWLFDTKSGVSQVLVEPKQSLDTELDAVDLKLSPSEDYLVFTNRTDLSLWALRLE